MALSLEQGRRAITGPWCAADFNPAVKPCVGKNTEGGEYEVLYVALMLQRGDKIARIEFFELEDLDAALARFEEFSATPTVSALSKA